MMCMAVYSWWKEPPTGDTFYWLTVGPVATGGSVGEEGTVGGEERKELVLEDYYLS
jgi:hypothetical protein